MVEEAFVWGWKEEVFYAWHPEAGEVSYHDPFGEIEDLVGMRKYPYAWSGVERQDRAFESLKCVAARKRVAAAAMPRGIEPWLAA